MGILDIAEQAAGAFAADKALETVDPNAGVLAKAVAAVAGFEGVGMLKEHFANSENTQLEAPQAEVAQDTSQDEATA